MTTATPPGVQPESRNAKADAKAAKAYYKASRPWYKKKRHILLLSVMLIVIVVAMNSGGSDSDTASDTSTTSKASSPEAAKKAAPKKAAPTTMKVRAAPMLREFEANEAAADAKYAGKTLRVTGVVEKVDTDLFDEDKYIIQLAGGGDFELFTVNCNGISASVAAKVNKGDKATVVGRFDDGGDLGVELKDCALA